MTQTTRLDAVRAAALDTWGNAKQADDFLVRDHPLLYGRHPLDVATESQAGADRVIEILGRLKYGTGV